jgi:hypothetical protein
MTLRNRIPAVAASLAGVAALTTPLAAPAQPPPPLPTYAHGWARDPFPYARPVAVHRVRRHRVHAYGPGYRYPAYGAYGYGYPGYGYPVYGYPDYGYPGYGYPGWYGGPYVSLGIGFRFGGGWGYVRGRWR